MLDGSILVPFFSKLYFLYEVLQSQHYKEKSADAFLWIFVSHAKIKYYEK